MSSYKDQIIKEKLPEHVAIIMDGNGRWAKKHGNIRLFGHQNGVKAVRQVVEAAGELGIKYLTLYTFSTENWNRPKLEIEGLMKLLSATLAEEAKKLHANNVRLKIIGDGSLPEAIRAKFDECEKLTENNTGLTLVLALSYSSRVEITDAVKKIAEEVKSGKLDVSAIDADVVSKHMWTNFMPDPELLIRTSGEYRISNYLLWQIAYSELYFTDTLWPDFGKEELYKAIVDYQGRERRFGKTSEQVQ
ncbi:MAG: isoprenyl transferase [Bacteroidales bacterium]|nr:isoprenyl transferase [Bacteroidales bacterium]